MYATNHSNCRDRRDTIGRRRECAIVDVINMVTVRISNRESIAFDSPRAGWRHVSAFPTISPPASVARNSSQKQLRPTSIDLLICGHDKTKTNENQRKKTSSAQRDRHFFFSKPETRQLSDRWYRSARLCPHRRRNWFIVVSQTSIRSSTISNLYRHALNSTRVSTSFHQKNIVSKNEKKKKKQK